MARTTLSLLLIFTSLFCFTAADEITLEFVMTDRQVPESRGPCDVPIQLIGKLPENLILRVRALTIAQYQNLTGNPDAFNDLPPAQSTDFDNSYDERLIFEQTGGFRQEKTVEVAIINDDINELNEEFLLFFTVVNNNIPVTINTTPDRNPTRCRIMNDDPIIVTFEMSSYTVPEGSSLEDIVFITKDGLTTEVDIEVNITATSRTAQIDVDFTTPNGGSEFTLDFLASENKIGVPILINTIVEGNRSFRLQFTATGADRLKKGIIIADITIIGTTPTPSTSQAPVPSTTQLSSSPLPSSLPLPNPEATVVPALTTSVQLTNVPQVTTNIPMPVASSMVVTSSEPQRTNAPITTNIPPECDEKDDKDIDLAIGLTFLITFLLTALCAVIIICFVVIADRKRRVYRHQQLH